MNALHLTASLACVPWLLATTAVSAEAPAQDAAAIARGRYLIRIMGCNDCHTQGFALSGGQVPESQWLAGDTLGYRGPWGTTYPPNLRLAFAKLTEDQWVKTGRSLSTRPPMPWFSVRALTDSDLRALYRFVRTLQPLGNPAPAFLPPDHEPSGPFVLFPAPAGK